MKNLFDINDKVIVITGAGGILGGATAEYLLSQGAHVVYLDLHEATVNSAVERVGEKYDKVSGYACNVLDEAAVNDVYEKIMSDIGRVDILINAAGGNKPGATVGPDQTIFDLNLDDYGKVLDLNLKGTLIPTIVFAKAFAESGSGCVLNFSSMAADRTLTRVLGYSNAKAGVDNLTKWMATELALRYGGGIRVNAIAPGFFVGNQNRALLLNEDGSYTERGQQIINSTPFRRFGEAEEVFGTIHYLISDAASFVTGIVVPVDGGFSAFSGV